MIQTILFDFDGTLFDTGEGILRSVQYALEGFGIHETDTARLRKFVGPPLFDSFSELYAMTPEQAQAAVARYRERYLPVGIYECTLYPGIPELLNKLSHEGVRLAVVSNKPDEAVRALTERYFPGVFPVAIGNRDGWATKPAPDSVYEAMRLLGARRESTVYVGDSDVDVDTARNAGLDSVIVTWGFRDEDFLRAHGAQHLAHNADELYEML